MELTELRDILLDLPNDSVTSALFILVDHMVDNPDSHYSYGNLGISVTDSHVELVDIENGTTIAEFTIKNTKEN